MKKFVILLFVAMAALSAKAQVYVGGTVALWHNDDLDATTFALNPEVGYNLNEKLAIGGVLTFAHSKLDEGKYNAFALALQSPNQKIPDRKTKCVIKTHINIKQNVIFGAKLKPV